MLNVSSCNITLSLDSKTSKFRVCPCGGFIERGFNCPEGMTERGSLQRGDLYRRGLIERRA